MPGFSVEIKEIKGGFIVRPAGRAGAPESEHFEEHLTSLMRLQPSMIVLDLSGLEYISSMGISALIRLHGAMKAAGGRVRMAAVPAPIATLIAAARLDNLIPRFDSLDSALEA